MDIKTVSPELVSAPYTNIGYFLGVDLPVAIAIGFLAFVFLLVVSSDFRRIFSPIVSFLAFILRVVGIPFFLWLPSPLVRFAWLSAAVGGLLWGGFFLAEPYNLVCAAVSVVLVLSIATEWSRNEDHREAIMRGTTGSSDYWLLMPTGKDGFFATPKKADQMPDLQWEGLLSSFLLFPSMSVLFSALVNVSAGPISNTSAAYYIVDRFLQTLPIDVLELMNWKGFSQLRFERPLNSVSPISAFEFAAGAILAFVVINGVTKALQIGKLSREAVDALSSQPELAIQIGPRAVRRIEAEWAFSPSDRQDRFDTIRYLVAALEMWLRDRKTLELEQIAVAISALGLSERAIKERGAERRVETSIRKVLQNLMDSSDDRSNPILKSAATALGELNLVGAWEDVTALAVDRNRDDNVRIAALKSLVGFREPKAATQIREILRVQTNKPELRIIAARGLGFLHRWVYVRWCLDVLETETDEDVQLALLRVLNGATVRRNAVERALKCARTLLDNPKTASEAAELIESLEDDDATSSEVSDHAQGVAADLELESAA